MHVPSDETDMERSCASCRTLHGVPRRQNRSVAGLVLAEVGSCPGLQLLFVGYGMGELFLSQGCGFVLPASGSGAVWSLPCTQLSCVRGLSPSCGDPASYLSRIHGLCHPLGTF